MGIWKPNLADRHPSWNAAGHTMEGLTRLVKQVEAAKDERMQKVLREELGMAMESLGVSTHMGWQFIEGIRRVRVVDKTRAAAWLAKRRLDLPNGRRAKQVLAKTLQAWITAHENDWPPGDVLDCDILWTVRRT
jgi:hypothetical protein